MPISRRVLLALLLAGPVGALYFSATLSIGGNIVHFGRTGFSACNGNYSDAFNSCRSFSVPLAWAELVALTALVILVALLLAGWVLAPIRAITDLITQLAPTSLSLRIRPKGPRTDPARRLGEAVDTLLDRVAEGYDAQRRFAANASHELRTPLATQRALIEISLQGPLNGDQLELLSRQLLATNERNVALIEGLLVLAETDRGLVTTTPQRLDDIVVAAIETLQPMAGSHHITIHTHTTPTITTGERPLLDRLLTNLVHNAIKYNTPDGTICITVNNPAAIVITNTGPQVAPHQVNALFEPFRRANADRLNHSGGVGLGLTIARSIVAAHHGTIAATANPAGGLTIKIQLPAAESP